MKEVIIFTKASCLFCAMIKSNLTREGIPFYDVDIVKNHDFWESIMNQTGNDKLIPTVIIKDENDNSGLAYVPGKDFKDTDELLELIKKNI